MSSPIGVAIIGGGIFVKEAHLPAVQASQDLALKAIYSRSLKTAKSVVEDVKDGSKVDLYSDDSDKSYADLLQRDDIKGVIIALPILVQPDFIKQALKAGKHVLAEKPLAKDVAAGRELIKSYHDIGGDVTFGVAEQFRYFNAFKYAAEQVGKLGRVLGVQLKMYAFVQEGDRYYDTPWRKHPGYQGGFLLDGGVHQTAGLRAVLNGGGVKIKKLSAQSALLQEHLPPVDTIDAALSLDNGATGSLTISFGTTFTGGQLSVACQKGTVTVVRDTVTVTPFKGEPVSVDKPNEGGGVHTEVFAWAKSILTGEQDPEQRPEEALADLELIEASLKSGENGGASIELNHQI